MPIEYEVRDGALVWIKNPITGVISYVVDVRGKSFAFTLGGRSELRDDLRRGAERLVIVNQAPALKQIHRFALTNSKCTR